MTTFELHLHCLHTMPTPALLRTVDTMRQAQQAADAQGDGERHYTLECLIEYAQEELETRRDSYTGEFDS